MKTTDHDGFCEILQQKGLFRISVIIWREVNRHQFAGEAGNQKKAKQPTTASSLSSKIIGSQSQVSFFFSFF